MQISSTTSLIITLNSYTTTVLRKFHEVGVGQNHGDNTPPPLSWKTNVKLQLHQCSQFVNVVLQPTTYPNVPTKRREHAAEDMDCSSQVSALKTEVGNVWHYLFEDTHPPHDQSIILYKKKKILHPKKSNPKGKQKIFHCRHPVYGSSSILGWRSAEEHCIHLTAAHMQPCF